MWNTYSPAIEKHVGSKLSNIDAKEALRSARSAGLLVQQDRSGRGAGEHLRKLIATLFALLTSMNSFLRSTSQTFGILHGVPWTLIGWSSSGGQITVSTTSIATPTLGHTNSPTPPDTIRTKETLT
jgi:hypothetical protein